MNTLLGKIIRQIKIVENFKHSCKRCYHFLNTHACSIKKLQMETNVSFGIVFHVAQCPIHLYGNLEFPGDNIYHCFSRNSFPFDWYSITFLHPILTCTQFCLLFFHGNFVQMIFSNLIFRFFIFTLLKFLGVFYSNFSFFNGNYISYNVWRR